MRERERESRGKICERCEGKIIEAKFARTVEEEGKKERKKIC